MLQVSYFRTVSIFFVTLVLYYTFLERTNAKLKQNSDFFKYFSIQNSFRKIFSLEVDKGTLPVITGIRVFSTASIILLHTFYYGSYANDNPSITQTSTLLDRMVVYSGIASINTFLAISGLLVGYKFCEDQTMKFKRSVINRYLRFAPDLTIVSCKTIFTPILIIFFLLEFVIGLHYVDVCK
jgi:3',5'-cyclic AMP phosphodiesterase CpdA